jgi:hypothetical protein
LLRSAVVAVYGPVEILRVKGGHGEFLGAVCGSCGWSLPYDYRRRRVVAESVLHALEVHDVFGM